MLFISSDEDRIKPTHNYGLHIVKVSIATKIDPANILDKNTYQCVYDAIWFMAQNVCHVVTTWSRMKGRRGSFRTVTQASHRYISLDLSNLLHHRSHLGQLV